MENQNYVFSHATGELRDKAIKLHFERYREVGFFKRDEVDPYEKESTYFVAQTKENSNVVGVIRLIRKELNELPTLQHFEIFDIERLKLSKLDRSQYAEISAFAKIPQHDVGLGLIRAAFRYSEHFGITHWVCCVDERVHKYLTRVFHFPFKVIGVPKTYLGSVSIPCYLYFPELHESVKQYRPSLYQFMTSESNYKEMVK
ncbi:N-acyl amino acid synthase FeeM domain-containing protein [Effusibacillus dendaii]|uniref:N-acyl amino acid synthase FeeM catalytic core domain-containing protein n=1 Tax=Effusibacillus dendaii TaxID=2743772 RepID=A0A7I8DGS1_9BACL|nr:acyl-homoserine-lactone synthase [Effusibacillus dendaii]BCJ88199.1 hypothetical protein skT53_31840 [Effusibacillus dendaii]